MEDLLALALEAPRDAEVRAEQILRESGDPEIRSYAHQCLGIVLRDRGHTGPALRHLRHALAAAEAAEAAEAAGAAGATDRTRDVRATLGGTLVYAGRAAEGIRQFDRALIGAQGEVAAKVAMRRAACLSLLGRYAEALPALRAAADGFERSGAPEWEGRSRVWAAECARRLGDLPAAEEDLARAEAAFALAGADHERLDAVAGRAELAAIRGDLAAGLAGHHEVASGYVAAKIDRPYDLVRIHAEAYAAAGLAVEAATLLESVASGAARVGELEEAELCQATAAAELAAGRPEQALRSARRAVALFGRQDRPWFELRARLVAARARHALAAGGPTPRGLRMEAAEIATLLHVEGAEEAPLALLLAADLHRGADRLPWLERAASYRTHRQALIRAQAAFAGARLREAAGDRAGALRAAARGLDAIDDFRRLSGSSELRAQVTQHGRDLTDLALRHAATGDPRTLLRWTERSRATSLALPPASAPAAISAPLAALRDHHRRVAEARREGAVPVELERERRRLERQVRSSDHQRGVEDADPAAAGPDVAEIVAAVGDACLVEIVDVDDTVHVLVVHAGRVRRRTAGHPGDIDALAGAAGMQLRRISRGRAANIAAVGAQLQQDLLAAAVDLLPANPDTPIVVAPPARWHGLAWALLPALAERPFSVVPSAGHWLRARAVPRPEAAARRTVLVAGPDLASGGAEVPVLADRHADAELLTGAEATAERVLTAIGGADLVHLATHGSFRADSPMFSALHLADGPLAVYDLEGLARAPYRIVLSACDSAAVAPVGAGELLGLTSALLGIGTAGLVSAVGEVNDAATAELMLMLHAALADGAAPATALLRARQQAAEDPIAAGTAATFLALGV